VTDANYTRCYAAGCSTRPTKPGRKLCDEHLARRPLRGPVRGLAIPGSWMVTGEGERRDCVHAYTCLSGASRQSGEAHCPPLCSAHEEPTQDEHNAERDHLASSRNGAGSVLPLGGWDE
jgi:hypothetical protein